MKNYYETLQVNENASKEIIEKAYKVLAKKYHPDLQADEKNKKIMEKKLKEINEAYHILSDSFLKEQYDIELEKEKQEKYKKMYGEQNYSTERGTHYQPNQASKSNQNTQNTRPGPQNNQTQQVTKKPQIGTLDSAIELVKELYYDRPKRQEYKEMTKKDIIAILLTIVAVLAIGLILWAIPFTNGWMREFLFENPLFQWIGSLFNR